MWLYDNADAGTNVRLIGEFPAQPAAEHPGQHQQGQPDEREKKIDSILGHGVVQPFEHRVEQNKKRSVENLE